MFMFFQVTQSQRDLQYAAHNDVAVDMETPPYGVSPPPYEYAWFDVTQNSEIPQEPPPKYESVAL